MKRRGFTLNELLIVVTIMAILTAVAVPHFVDAKFKAQQSCLYVDLKNLRTALELYKMDYGTYAPGASTPYMTRVIDTNALPELTSPVSYFDPDGVFQRMIPTPIFYGGPPDGGGSVLVLYRGLLYDRGARFKPDEEGVGFRCTPDLWQLVAGNPGYIQPLPALPILTLPEGSSLLNEMTNAILPLDEYPPPCHLPINPFYGPSNGVRSMGDFYLNSFGVSTF